ncbi:hsp20/alpha crystallin family domain-containing protein [Ditylenchus destructor]|uniref:Hsp20/alpha crystallin family domain-containing protein n=1 Tax=Ditylenchus destructor TaxID=166010 RepID=A0AAD4R4B2_9BILA|nr:hsp20/alpha crystallin family domain-containing protein [Ditylenchus destructor]KAI1717594.1 hsp20/alpha crystallin family domain-containing protein [Ditylenchus destructor]
MTSDVQTRVEGNQVHITCNAEGYAPEEIKVTVEGNDVVVNAEHVVDTGGKKVQKSYSRRIGLPRDVMKNTVKCNLNGGQLVITAQIPVEPKSTITSSFKSVSIPVHFK